MKRMGSFEEPVDNQEGTLLFEGRSLEEWALYARQEAQSMASGVHVAFRAEATTHVGMRNEAGEGKDGVWIRYYMADEKMWSRFVRLTDSGNEKLVEQAIKEDRIELEKMKPFIYSVEE